MRSHLFASLLASVLALAPAASAAQQGATVSGRVTSSTGAALSAATVSIGALGIGTQTRDDGTYSLTVPAGRLASITAPVAVSVRRLGFRAATQQVTLTAGNVTQDFTLTSNPLQLGEVVITGQGTETQTEKLGSVRNNVSAEDITRSNEQNVVQALAAKAPNVEVTASSGEPGASSYIRMRGQRTILGNTQPLFVVDGVPIDNSSFSTSNFNPADELNSGEISGTAQMNRAVDINPNDIENIEILKGPAASAIYGARAAQGVVLITTKKGRAGATRFTFENTTAIDDISRTYPLQRRYGQGRFGESALPCDDINKGTCVRSWGSDLRASGATTYDHASEAYDTGLQLDNTFSASGGTDRTSFFASGSYLTNEGVFKGPNNEFTRATARLNASHRLTDKVDLRINGSFADVRGDYVQRGNNVNGLQLGLLRTPPDFNNLPYLDPITGLHRSFRLQNPSAISGSDSRGFDNPFFALHEPINRSRVGRVFGSAQADYYATSWLKFNYTLGSDYSTDERLEGAPQASSDVSAGGRITEGDIVISQFDHNLSGTANWSRGENLAGTLTLGQNLNVRNSRLLAVVGRTLVAPEPFKLSNTVNRDLPIDTETNIHQESYFAQATVDLWNQLFLTAAVRNDGSTTFSEKYRRNWFPKGSAAWTVTDRLPLDNIISFGKLRAAYGEAGVEPLAYLTSTIFDGSTLLTGIAQGTGLSPTQAGFGGLYTGTVKGADLLKPERTKETEAGIDLGFFQDRADASFTWYDGTSDDVIFLTPLSPSSGYLRQAQNSARLRNTGLEVALNLRPIQRANFGWDVGLQWAQNRSKVLELVGADFVNLELGGTITPNAVAKQGQPLGAFYDYGWVRCGRSPEGMDAAVPGVDLATVCQGQPDGALYIDDDGFPVGDDNQRIIGDPNPKWTGSLRSSFRIRSLTFSGLVDIRNGGVINNGTRGALRSYGTHKDTEVRATCTPDGACTGNEKVFGQAGWYQGPVVGPGANMAVPIGENWWRQHPASDNCVFSGYGEACMEDGGYAKLRELSVAWRLDGGFVRRTLGLSSLDLRVAGRNLFTWTNYEGYDPETNLGGAIQNTRGMDYFNMPQARSFVFSVNLTK